MAAKNSDVGVTVSCRTCVTVYLYAVRFFFDSFGSTESLSPIVFSNFDKVSIFGLPDFESVLYKLSRPRSDFFEIVAKPCAAATCRKASKKTSTVCSS